MKDFYEQWFNLLYDGGYFELGHPHRSVRDANTATDLLNYVGRNNGNRDLYISLFPYRKLQNNKPEYGSFVFDRMCIDIDFDGKLTDRNCRRVWEFCDWLDNLDWEYWLHFSGNRGFHIYFTFPEVNLQNHERVMSKLKSILSDRFSAIDTVAFNSKAQMIRIPNTQHTDTGLYCIPVEKSDLMLGVDKITSQATSPNWGTSVPHRFDNKPLVDTLKDWDKKVSQAPRRKSSDVDITDKCNHMGTIKLGVQYGKRDHALSYLALRLKAQGVSQKKAMKTLVEWNQNNKPPLNDGHVRYKVNYFYKNNYQKVGPCWFAKQVMNNFCNNCEWS